MPTALFLNGVYEETLKEIEDSQHKHPGQVFCLQPYKGAVIRLLEKKQPTVDHTIRLYISVTTSLGIVSFQATIVGWYDKRKLTDKTTRLSEFNERINELQPKEGGIHLKLKNGNACVNLLLIRNLERLVSPFAVSHLRKVSDDTCLKVRSRAGGWSPVIEQAEWLGRLPAVVFKDHQEAEEGAFQRSAKDSSEARKKRLETASKIPVQIQVIAREFRRNPDVKAEVLERAQGRCEKCKKPAPFDRFSDGKPYLEVHHMKMLAEGGEDSCENAVALCPNCHRKYHYGKHD
jgi:5-methylcytosine-specific restriction endonuclease McrA